MPKAYVVLFVLTAAFSSLTWVHGEDTRVGLQRAQDFEKAGRRTEAIAAYREVLGADPRCLEARVGLGRSYYAVGEYAQAEASFEKGLQLQPGDPAIINWLGRSYLQEHRPAEVLELVEREGLGGSKSAWVHMLLARAYDQQSKLDEAVHEIQQALELDPHCRGAHFAQGFLAWGTGDLATAEQELRQEMDLDPHESLAAYYLAEVLGKLGKFAEAEAALTQMGQEARDTYLYHLGVGKLYEREKNDRAAAEHYRKAIDLDPKQPEAHYRLGVALRALGETAKANEEFRTFGELQTHTELGVAQGMGRMRPYLLDFDYCQAGGGL